jgi:hypothetical protein
VATTLFTVPNAVIVTVGSVVYPRPVCVTLADVIVQRAVAVPIEAFTPEKPVSLPTVQVPVVGRAVPAVSQDENAPLESEVLGILRVPPEMVPPPPTLEPL